MRQHCVGGDIIDHYALSRLVPPFQAEPAGLDAYAPSQSEFNCFRSRQVSPGVVELLAPLQGMRKGEAPCINGWMTPLRYRNRSRLFSRTYFRSIVTRSFKGITLCGNYVARLELL